MANCVLVSDGVTKAIIKYGYGNIPQPGNIITVHCTGSIANPPRRFWSTKDPGQTPFTFQVGLGKVIRGEVENLLLTKENKNGFRPNQMCWDEGCLTMQQGEIAIITIRSDKGYGRQGFPAWGIPPNADLMFEIEILNIQ